MTLTMTLILVATIGAPQAPGITEAMTDNRVCYLFPVQTDARAKPDPAAPVVNTFKPFAIALVKGAAAGWAYVEPTAGAKTADAGWIRTSPENIVETRGGALALVRRRDAVESRPWSNAVKLDLIRGRVRIGFTKEQLQIAYLNSVMDKGEPQRKATEETSAGIVETWAYPGVVYTLKADRVTKISRIE